MRKKPTKKQIEFLQSKKGREKFLEISKEYNLIQANPISRQTFYEAFTGFINGTLRKDRQRKYMEYFGFVK